MQGHGFMGEEGEDKAEYDLLYGNTNTSSVSGLFSFK